jgi:hypothetical protein
MAVEEVLREVVLLPTFGSKWSGVLLLLPPAGLHLWWWRLFPWAWLQYGRLLSTAVCTQYGRPHTFYVYSFGKKKFKWGNINFFSVLTL